MAKKARRRRSKPCTVQYLECNRSGKPRKRNPDANSPDKSRTIKIGCHGKLKIVTDNKNCLSGVFMSHAHNHDPHMGNPPSYIMKLAMATLQDEVARSGSEEDVPKYVARRPESSAANEE